MVQSQYGSFIVLKYLVTGGAGFIGSNIVDVLVQQGEFVRVIDNFSTGKVSNLEDVSDKVDFVRGDIQDLSLVREAVKDVDYVIHQAALSSVEWSVDDPIYTSQGKYHGNIECTGSGKRH